MKNSLFLEQGTHRIHYQVIGQGKTLLLLHGGLGCLNEMQPLADHLAERYRVISLDFSGHGLSTLGPQPSSYAAYQHDVECVLKHLGVEHYSVIGFSDGGIVGYRLASAAVQQVDSLITLGAQWRLQDTDPARPLLEGLTAATWQARFPQAVADYQSTHPQPDFPALVAAVKRVWLDTSAQGYPDESVTKITCPVLILRGESDFLFTLDEAVQLKKRLPSAHFANLPFASHAVHQECPTLVHQLIDSFLEQYE